MRRGTAFVALLLLAGLVPREAAAGPALVLEVSNSKVLHAEDADSSWHPASLTKMMTAYLVFEALKAGKLELKSKISCSAAANGQPPSKIGLPVGGEMTVDQGLQALIIKSANDVAVMLAEAVAGKRGRIRRQHERHGPAPRHGVAPCSSTRTACRRRRR